MIEREKLYNALNELIPMISSYKDCERQNKSVNGFIDVASSSAGENIEMDCHPLKMKIINYIDRLDEDTLRGIKTLYINCRYERESDDNPAPTEEQMSDPNYSHIDGNKYILENDFDEFSKDNGEGLRADVIDHCLSYDSVRIFDEAIDKYNLIPSF